MRLALALSACCLLLPLLANAQDGLRDFQTKAIQDGKSPVAHWGWQPDKYTQWGSHSNRLIPVYTFGTLGKGKGVDLTDYTGQNSVYRSSEALAELYGQLPRDTVNPTADYLDQTDIYRLQAAAADAGKKYIFLVVFDGMDWQTTHATATYNLGKVAYLEGRGSGTCFQSYQANGTSQFGFMVTSPHNNGTNVNVDTQTVNNPGGSTTGGYSIQFGGETPWAQPADVGYPITDPQSGGLPHAYTDSSSSATSMTAGIKTYNNGVTVDATGKQVDTIAHQLQQRGWSVGAVTSVPISHATPASAYAHNVHRNDYQDLTRDLLGLPSVSHPQPLKGLDVLIGTGWGKTAEEDSGQGENYVPGNTYLTDRNLKQIDVKNHGKYVVAIREAGKDGKQSLQAAAEQAAAQHRRLFGFYGVAGTGHLPFQTANGDYQPAPGRAGTAETYTPADLAENPTLADMTQAALTVLNTNPNGFWLMVEAGDVDWANHDNNLDNSIGAVNSGDLAFQQIVAWVEANSNWDESLVILTADHGHYLNVLNPQTIADLGQAESPTP